MYDSNNNLLSTNLYGSPPSVTIYPNGSAYSNYLSVSTQGVAKFVFVDAPVNCVSTNEAAGGAYASIFLLDADLGDIIGPLANPLNGYMVAVNGAGLGSADLYVASTYGVYSADHSTIYDTSIYTPFVALNPVEGSVELYGQTYNMPALFGAGSEGGAGFQASPAYTNITVGTYVAVALNAGSLTAFAIEETIPGIQACNSFTTYPAMSNPTVIGSMADAGTGLPVLDVMDGQNVDILSSGSFIDESSGYPQAYFILSTYAVPGSETPVNLFESNDVRGRLFLIGNSTNNPNGSGLGEIDQFNLDSGAFSLQGTYFMQDFAATQAVRIAGESGSGQYGLYYSEPGTAFIYGVDRSGGSNVQYPVITAWSSGQIYAMQPSGLGYNYIFFRGYNGSSDTYQLCSVDPTVGFSPICMFPNGDTSYASIRYDPGSGELLAVYNTRMYSFNAHVAPSSFVSSMAPAYSGFTANQSSFIPSVATPGFVGVYSSANLYTTFLQYSSGVWSFAGLLYWPNSSIATLY